MGITFFPPGIPQEDAVWRDAFGRWRVSTPTTLFDSKMNVDDQDQLWTTYDSTSGAGDLTETYNTNQSSVTLDYTPGGGPSPGTIHRQTRMRFPYQPGKSTLTMITFVLKPEAGSTGVQRRIGLFDDKNGLFLEDDAGTVKFVRRTYTSGSAVDNETAQSSWDDPMDGTGASGITLDFTKTQILFIDFEWLGVGSVRFGFVVDGKLYVAHQLNHANSLALVYMSSPNLPVRFELVTTASSSAATMKAICATVMSEAGLQPLGHGGYLSTAGTHLDLATENTLYLVMGIRLKSDHLGAYVQLTDVSIQEQTGTKLFEWVLVFNPTYSSAPTWSAPGTMTTHTAVQTCLGNGTITISGGDAITGGFLSSGIRGGAGGSALESLRRLGEEVVSYAYQPETIALGVRPVGGSTNIDIEASLTWNELE